MTPSKFKQGYYKFAVTLIISLLSLSANADDDVVIINQTAGNESSEITIAQTQDEASASANHLEITQGEGESNAILALQRNAVDSRMELFQEGSNNQLSAEQVATVGSQINVSQIGNSNIVDILQAYITNGTINVDIDGNGNNVDITQGAEGYYSSNNRIDYAAFGDNNTAVIEQYGSKNSIDLTQDGSDNTANIQQYGSGHQFELVQEGNGGSIDICQGDECS